MAASQSVGQERIGAYREDLETLWRMWDDHFARVSTERWSQRYGKDWTFADVPYHLAYFDRIMVADAIEQGRDLPESERFQLRSTRQLNDWNATEFAKRPAGQTPEQSIAALRRERQRISSLIEGMTDADLAHPAFNHFFDFGWGTVEDALAGDRLHNWSELAEFGYRLDGRVPTFPSRITHAGLAIYMSMFASFANPSAANGKPLTVRMSFDGPGGGDWTIAVRPSGATSEEGAGGTPDVTMRMAPATFLLMFKQIKPAPLLILARKIRMKGFSKMPLFSKVFAPPPLDREIATRGARFAPG